MFYDSHFLFLYPRRTHPKKVIKNEESRLLQRRGKGELFKSLSIMHDFEVAKNGEEAALHFAVAFSKLEESDLEAF